jgi:predicted AAA+ superfamily ATPase
MLRRKAYARFEAWKQNKTRQALLVTGARQVGKTTLVREFARQHYQQIAEINFYDNEQAVHTVAAARDARDLHLRLSALSRTEFIPENTLVFLDEIQECGDVLTWLKFLAERSGCDYVLSGSLLGLESFNARSLPVGFLQTIDMYPMDFAEFCWAEGISQALLDEATTCLANREPVPDYLHGQLIDTYYRYLLVGGMPAAVQVFIDSDDLVKTRNEQTAILELYRHDIAKYVSDKTEARQIRLVYESIPGQLANANKRFKYTRLGKNLRFANLETAFDWLACAGVALPTVKVTDPVFPLGLSVDNNALKLYMNDVGLLTASLMGEVDIGILNRKSSLNFGSIFENAAAQELKASGFELFYYNSNNNGEIDFVLQDVHGNVSLCEIKSGKDYRRHSALNNLLKSPNYYFEAAYVFCEDNIQCRSSSNISYLPIYLLGFLRDNIIAEY